ncbi:N-acetyltransferase [Streptomyces kunmingensis]|uniref:N-acetyltransferase n=1 Tax=Streptomyces kunmingensis TaxID=68225 RepID=A0ABU6C3J1_9ACTN|nr:GNAT family N-acetyltransferase [Streptomyces kunmingensis]MEB3959291.1 N-acetyltransferase [Streptomyces kunmingensis]
MSGIDTDLYDDRDRGLLTARAGGAAGEIVGYLQYFVLDEPAPALVAAHTVVDRAHEGKGIAGSLARELYALAARETLAVAPLCSFVAAWAERHPGEAPAAPAELLAAAEAALAAEPEKW